VNSCRDQRELDSLSVATVLPFLPESVRLSSGTLMLRSYVIVAEKYRRLVEPDQLKSLRATLKPGAAPGGRAT